MSTTRLIAISFTKTSSKSSSSHAGDTPKSLLLKLQTHQHEAFSKLVQMFTNGQMDTGYTGMTYSAAGVSIDAGNQLVDRIKPLCKATSQPGCLGNGIGGFGGLFDPKVYRSSTYASAFGFTSAAGSTSTFAAASAPSLPLHPDLHPPLPLPLPPVLLPLLPPLLLLLIHLSGCAEYTSVCSKANFCFKSTSLVYLTQYVSFSISPPFCLPQLLSFSVSLVSLREFLYTWLS